MRLDIASVVGAILGLALAVPVSSALEVRPGSPPQPGPVVAPAPRAAGAGATRPGISPQTRSPSSSVRVSRSVEREGSEPGAVLDAPVWGSARANYAEAPIKIPTFAGLPMGRKLTPCPFDKTYFSDDCTPRY